VRVVVTASVAGRLVRAEGILWRRWRVLDFGQVCVKGVAWARVPGGGDSWFVAALQMGRGLDGCGGGFF